MPIDFNSPGFVIAAIVGGPTLSGIVVAWMTYKFGRLANNASIAAAARAVQVAADNETNQAKAQADAAVAQKGVLEAAERLVIVARGTDAKLADVVSAAAATDITLAHIKSTGDKTLVHVNSEKTAALRLIADLRRELANNSPGDIAKARAAAKAEAEAVASEQGNDAAAKLP